MKVKIIHEHDQALGNTALQNSYPYIVQREQVSSLISSYWTLITLMKSPIPYLIIFKGSTSKYHDTMIRISSYEY